MMLWGFPKELLGAVLADGAKGVVDVGDDAVWVGFGNDGASVDSFFVFAQQAFVTF